MRSNDNGVGSEVSSTGSNEDHILARARPVLRREWWDNFDPLHFDKLGELQGFRMDLVVLCWCSSSLPTNAEKRKIEQGRAGSPFPVPRITIPRLLRRLGRLSNMVDAKRP